MIRKNPLRELLKHEKPTIGTHLHSTWPGFVEVIGHTGVIDYVEFTGEYAPYDLYALENFARAVDLFDHMSAMMKIEQEPRVYLATRANGSGIQNLLFADIHDAAEAERAIAASRADTPQTKGLAGAAMRRDVGYVLAPGSREYVQALEKGVVALMIEKHSALGCLDEILSLEGLDMVQFGPADYSMTIGLPGQWGDPAVRKAERLVIETAIQSGIRPRVEINDFQQAKPYIDMGVKDFCIGWDVLTIHEYCKRQGEGLGKLLGR